MAYFVDGTLYPFLTPLELLRFAPLAFPTGCGPASP